MIANDSSSIVVDARWEGSDGIGRFSREVLNRLPGVTRLQSPLGPLHPLDCLCWGLRGGRDARCFFSPGFNAPVFCRRPFVFTIHDLIHLECPEESSAAKSLYYRFVVKPAARRAYRVLTVSEYSRQRIAAWAGLPRERIVVVRNGISRVFAPGGPVHRPGYDYLLYVGNQKPHKNIDRLLAAVARAVAGTSLRLVMTGSPAAATRAAAQRLGIEDRIEFAGLLPDERLAACYRGAKLLVVPSLFEGFGLPVVEAMACGAPVVCSQAGPLPEICGGAAWLVDPLDVADIADGIRRVLGNDRLRESLRYKGLEQASKFDWDATAATIRAILLAAAQGRDRV
jgi:glycosyltransferase involved in cell wall biosynthesis